MLIYALLVVPTLTHYSVKVFSFLRNCSFLFISNKPLIVFLIVYTLLLLCYCTAYLLPSVPAHGEDGNELNLEKNCRVHCMHDFQVLSLCPLKTRPKYSYCMFTLTVKNILVFSCSFLLEHFVYKPSYKH